MQIHALFVPGEVHAGWKKEYLLKASGAFNFEVSQVGAALSWRQC